MISLRFKVGNNYCFRCKLLCFNVVRFFIHHPCEKNAWPEKILGSASKNRVGRVTGKLRGNRHFCYALP